MHDDTNEHTQFIFADCVLTQSGILWRAARKIALPPKEYHVLTVLLLAEGAVVTKEHLLDRVWGTPAVSEASLTRCIYALRRLLGENKHRRFIDTHYAQGYRFCYPVTRVAMMKPPAFVIPVLFHHACHLMQLGCFVEAKRVLHDCLASHPDLYVAHLLRAWVTRYLDQNSEASGEGPERERRLPPWLNEDFCTHHLNGIKERS